MNAFLIEGFTDAYRNLGAALRLFWPLLAIMLLGYVVSFMLAAAWFSSDAADNPRLLVMWPIGVFGVLTYILFIVCQGAVSWHRRVLLNENSGLDFARAATPCVSVCSRGFPVRSHVLGRAYGRRVFPDAIYSSLMAPMVQELDPASSTTDQLETMWKLTWRVQIAMFLFSVAIVSAVLWLARSWLLVFPHISIRTVQPAFGSIKDSLNISGWLSCRVAGCVFPAVSACSDLRSGYSIQDAAPAMDRRGIHYPSVHHLRFLFSVGSQHSFENLCKSGGRQGTLLAFRYKQRSPRVVRGRCAGSAGRSGRAPMLMSSMPATGAVTIKRRNRVKNRGLR